MSSWLVSEDLRYYIGFSIPAIFRSKVSKVFLYQKLRFLFRNKPTYPCRCYRFPPDPLLDLFPIHLISSSLKIFTTYHENRRKPNLPPDTVPPTGHVSMTNLATVVAVVIRRSAVSLVISDSYAMAPGLRSLAWSKEWPMIDSDVEEYVREHQERVRKLEELYEKIGSPEYNDEEKNNFRNEPLKLCLEGLATV